MSSPNPDVEIFRAIHGSQMGAEKNDDAHIEQLINEYPRETIPIAAMTMDPGGSFHRAAQAFSNRRGFFVTEGGRMGTAAARVETSQGRRAKALNLVQAGDRIAVVAGMEMPIVLRPIAVEHDSDSDGGERAYHLVTHAYVHGIMHGEAWEDGNTLPTEVILV